LPGNPTSAYLLLRDEELAEKAREAEEILKSCRLCPRECGVDRTQGEEGFCGVLDRPFVSSWGPHHGEERPISGRRGSGTIFFSGCNLGCIFCQNWQISHGREGREFTHKALAGIMLDLQRTGCHNINLVTPTHQMPMILRSLSLAKDGGLRLPIVYNTGGYDSIEALEVLDGVVDIYMPDMKCSDPEAAERLSSAGDYPGAVRAALREMHRQVGDLVMDQRGIAQRGLLVRHLVLPGGLAGTGEVVRFIAGEISKNTYINIMDQYHPCFGAFDHPPLDRRITREEYTDALRAALNAGLKRIDGMMEEPL
jgi:putative pyruvate formate lyase activating enzyme